jgi:hypothetical protein
MTIRTLEIIHDEHQALAAMLRSLSMLLAHARPPRRASRLRRAARDALLHRRVSGAAAPHEGKRTAVSAAARTCAGARRRCSTNSTTTMRIGEAAIRELEHALLAFEVMGPSRREAFEAAVQRYIGFYLEHMATGGVAGAAGRARRLRCSDDWLALDAAFEANRDPLSGHEPADEYRALFRRIAMAAPAPIGLLG